MTHLVTLKNVTTRVINIAGKDLAPGESFEVTEAYKLILKTDNEVFSLISSGDIIVNNGTKDLSAIEGWQTLIGDNSFPISEIGSKIWVHSSSKPVLPDTQLYVQWIGAGDDTINHIIGEGPLGIINNSPGTPISTVDFEFDESFGAIYIHEGFATWQNAQPGDYLSALIVAEGTHLQQVQNLDLVLDSDNYVLYSTGGPGTGTHGFASQPYLLNRTFSKDGDWDYSAATSLVPNFTKTGEYKINVNEMPVHRFINKLPIFGTNTNPFRMPSEDTFDLPHGYFLRIEAHNVSNTDWQAAIMITVYRARTF